MYSLGIDVGYSSVKLSLADDEGIITADIYHLHGGDVRKGLKASIGELQKKHPLNQIGFGAVTGRGSEILTSRGLIGVVSEVPALLEGILASYPEGGSVVEIGGQNGRFITDFSEGDSSRIKISVNSNCSAGTGSFLEEQVSRLDLKLQDYSRLASAARSIPRIAGRCSVFARTDIIHHQQEGIPVKDILQGLAYAVVRNYRGVVVKKAALSLPVIFTGGVAYNDSVKEALRKVFSLTEGDVMVPSFPGNMAARGAAMIAARDRMILDLGAILTALDDEVSAGTGDMPTMKSPSLSGFGAGDAAGRHLIIPGKNTGRIRAYLGVDVGSTSTNLVLMNENKDILACKYLKTLGDPLSAVKRGLAEIEREAGGGIERQASA